MDTDETATMAAAASDAGVRCWTGLQARSVPAVRHVRELVAEGAIGEVFSSTLVATGMRWGPTVDPDVECLLDVQNGGTFLTIPFGHAFDALAWCLGEPETLSAVVETRRTLVRNTGTGAMVPMTAPDQVAVVGRLEGGAVASVHYRGGRTAGLNFHWEINGTEGDLVLSGDVGHLQFGAVTLQRAEAGGTLEAVEIPARHESVVADRAAPSYPVAQAYAGILQELEGGASVVPTFEDALRRHRTLDLVREAAVSGSAQSAS